MCSRAVRELLFAGVYRGFQATCQHWFVFFLEEHANIAEVCVRGVSSSGLQVSGLRHVLTWARPGRARKCGLLAGFLLLRLWAPSEAPGKLARFIGLHTPLKKCWAYKIRSSSQCEFSLPRPTTREDNVRSKKKVEKTTSKFKAA